MRTFIFTALMITLPSICFAEGRLDRAKRLIAEARRSQASSEMQTRKLSISDSIAADDGQIDEDDSIWPQYGHLVSHDNLDMAIQGQGFFSIRDPRTKELHFTRNGKFKIDNAGYLAHWNSSDRLLAYTNMGYGEIKLTDYAVFRDPAVGVTSEIQSFDVTLDGRILATYKNGAIRKVAKLAIAAFSSPSALQKIDLFTYMSPSGYQPDEKSSVYGSSLEELAGEDVSDNL